MCCTQTEFKPHDLAAACWSCRASRARPGYCGDTGATIADVTIGGRPCPRGKHPTARRPTFGWLGVRWRGVPMPVRWAIAALGGVAPEDFAGCGCLDRLKAAVERAAGIPGAVWAWVGIGRASGLDAAPKSA